MVKKVITPFMSDGDDWNFTLYWREKGKKKWTKYSGLGSRSSTPLQFKIVAKKFEFRPIGIGPRKRVPIR